MYRIKKNRKNLEKNYIKIHEKCEWLINIRIQSKNQIIEFKKDLLIKNLKFKQLSKKLNY